MNELTYRERQALSLGATMYVPGTHVDLKAIVSSNKTGARSLVICTEDAVSEKDVATAIENIRQVLPHMQTFEENGVQIFIRPRNTEVLKILLEFKSIERSSGFVLPKFQMSNIEQWADAMEGADPLLGVMPTLETAEVFDADAMKFLGILLKKGALSSRVIALRIGGNDLLNCLGLRRPRNATMYSTPLGATISSLVTVFRPLGFMLTAPVFEHITDTEMLRAEVALDRSHGLVGKTAIHPSQIQLIENGLAPSTMEIEEAEAILAVDAPAVFKLNGSMCEPATHHHWAKMIQFMARNIPDNVESFPAINAA